MGCLLKGSLLNVDQHKKVITMKTIRSAVKSWKIMDFHSYRNLLFLFRNFQTCMLSNLKSALNDALFILKQYLGVVGLCWGRSCTKTK